MKSTSIKTPSSSNIKTTPLENPWTNQKPDTLADRGIQIRSVTAEEMRFFNTTPNYGQKVSKT